MRKYTILMLFCLYAVTSLYAQPCNPNPSSLEFNGTSGSVKINSTGNLEITGNLTVEAWVFVNQFGASWTSGSIFCHHAWDASSYGYVLRAGGSGQLSFNVASGGGTWKEAMSAIGTIPQYAWVHVAGTYDGTMVRCYIMGVEAGSIAYTGTIPTSSWPPRIGDLSDTVYWTSMAHRCWNGFIDEVKVWNRALTPTELQNNLYVQIDPTAQTGLVGYWRLNEGFGNSITDLSGSNNYGANVGASWTTSVPYNNGPPPVPSISFVSNYLVSSSSTGNQWNLDGTPIPGATGPTYWPLQVGNYTVTVTDANNCSSTSGIFPVSTVGIENIKKEFSITPNPARDFLYVNQQGGTTYESFEIADLTGMLVLKGELSSKSETKIDIGKCPPGIYLIKLINSSGNNFLRKFVIY